MAVNGERKYTMRAYKDLCAAINKKILNSDWTSRMVTRALWSAFASAGKQRTKVMTWRWVGVKGEEVRKHGEVVETVRGRDGFAYEGGADAEVPAMVEEQRTVA